MGAASSPDAVYAPVSERNVCCFELFSFLLCRCVSGSRPHTPVWRRQFFFTSMLSPSSSDILSCPSSTPLNFVSSSPSNFLFSAVSPLHNAAGFSSLSKAACPLNCPCQLKNWTCFIEANPHVHCVHTFVHVHLDHCSVSNVSNVRILFIQHDSVSGSDNFLHRNKKGSTTLAHLNVMHL